MAGRFQGLLKAVGSAARSGGIEDSSSREDPTNLVGGVGGGVGAAMHRHTTSSTATSPTSAGSGGSWGSDGTEDIDMDEVLKQLGLDQDDSDDSGSGSTTGSSGDLSAKLASLDKAVAQADVEEDAAILSAAAVSHGFSVTTLFPCWMVFGPQTSTSSVLFAVEVANTCCVRAGLVCTGRA